MRSQTLETLKINRCPSDDALFEQAPAEEAPPAAAAALSALSSTLSVRFFRNPEDLECCSCLVRLLSALSSTLSVRSQALETLKIDRCPWDDALFKQAPADEAPPAAAAALSALSSTLSVRSQKP